MIRETRQSDTSELIYSLTLERIDSGLPKIGGSYEGLPLLTARKRNVSGEDYWVSLFSSSGMDLELVDPLIRESKGRLRKYVMENGEFPSRVISTRDNEYRITTEIIK